MSRLSDAELRLLRFVSSELQEVFSERGHRVDVALDADPSFGSGQARGWLTRDLVVAAVSEAASQVGMWFGPVNGSGRELIYSAGWTERHYRVLRGKRLGGGELRVVCSEASSLAHEESDEHSLLRREDWAFVWIPSADGQIDEVLAAEILGYEEGSPGFLRLGMTFELAGGDGAQRGFRPTDEPLPGFEDEEPDDGFGVAD